MNKYRGYERQPSLYEPRNGVHPIWQGIGFGLMVLTPILAYFGALVLLDENAKRGWIAIPPDMLAPGRDPLLYMKIALTVALMLVIFTVFQLIAFVLYRLFGPPRYGPLDVPPVSFRGRRKSR